MGNLAGGIYPTFTDKTRSSFCWLAGNLVRGWSLLGDGLDAFPQRFRRNSCRDDARDLSFCIHALHCDPPNTAADRIWRSEQALQTTSMCADNWRSEHGKEDHHERQRSAHTRTDLAFCHPRTPHWHRRFQDLMVLPFSRFKASVVYWFAISLDYEHSLFINSISSISTL